MTTPTDPSKRLRSATIREGTIRSTTNRRQPTMPISRRRLDLLGGNVSAVSGPIGLEAMPSSAAELAELVRKDTAMRTPIVSKIGFTAEG